MRRVLLFTPILALAAAPAVAQIAGAPSPPPRGSIVLAGTSVAPGASVEVIVTRLLSFDRNGDGRLTLDELPERMESVLARGDINRDGALDAGEIRRLARTPRQIHVAATGVGQIGTGNRYGFADEFSFSSRDHIEGAVDDLKLAGPVADDVRMIAGTFVDRVDAAARADLMKELAEVLSPADLATFERSFDQLQTLTRGRVTMVANTGQATVTVVGQAGAGGAFQGFNTFVAMTATGALLNRFGLSAGDRARADAALERHGTRLRPGEADWTPLMAALTPLLADEERDDLRAALDRRPVVALTGPVARAR
jgi:hypothetical protein